MHASANPNAIPLEARNTLRKLASRFLREAIKIQLNEGVDDLAALQRAYQDEIERNGGDRPRVYGDGSPVFDTFALAWDLARGQLTRQGATLESAAEGLDDDRGRAH